jgi:hypothetical protein
MAYYGHSFISLDDLEKEGIYNVISSYFDNPTFTKIKEDENHSIYAVRIKSLLSAEQRFLIAIKPKDNFNIGHTLKLKEIDWVSFQTRVLDETYNLSGQQYNIKKAEPYTSSISLINRTPEASTYNSSLFPNILVTLLHKKKDSYEYSDKGSLLLALETYRTVITFT